MTISIVLTTFDRSHQLRATFISIAEQGFKEEVVVVDDGFDDETPALCWESWPFRIKHFRLNRFFSGECRSQAVVVNYGVKQASGEVVILQNAECLHVGNVIAELVGAVTPNSVAICRTEHLSAEGFNLGVLPTHDCKAEGQALFFCGAIYRDLFLRLGGMDEDFVFPTCEDNDFSHRLKKAGVRFDYLPATVRHQWHPSAGTMRPDALAESLRLLKQKTVDMALGRIGAERNLGREWGMAPRMDNRVVQSFWIGSLTPMEKLCIRSFLANGHEFHLYTYGGVEGVPEGVVVKDANEILPELRVRQLPSLQQSADFFRVALLLARGGWWVDMDVVCLRPFDFSAVYVFGASVCDEIVQNCIMKAPPGSPIMRRWYDYIDHLSEESLKRLAFQDIGPALLGELVPEFGLQRYVLPRETFDPVGYDLVARLVDPTETWDLRGVYAIHCFHAAWRGGHEHAMQPSYRALTGTGDRFPASCLYERLKERFL
jgi:hypothetical protein